MKDLQLMNKKELLEEVRSNNYNISIAKNTINRNMEEMEKKKAEIESNKYLIVKLEKRNKEIEKTLKNYKEKEEIVVAVITKKEDSKYIGSGHYRGYYSASDYKKYMKYSVTIQKRNAENLCYGQSFVSSFNWDRTEQNSVEDFYSTLSEYIKQFNVAYIIFLGMEKPCFSVSKLKKEVKAIYLQRKEYGEGNKLELL